MTPQNLTKAKIDLYGRIVCDPRARAHGAAVGVAWLLLFKYLNSEKGVAWPSAQTLADDLGASLRSVRYGVTWLTAEGWFTPLRSRGRTTNRYRPNFPTVQPIAPLAGSTVQRSAPNGAMGGISTVQPIAPNTFKEPYKEHFARVNQKKSCSAMAEARLENSLYYRRLELASNGLRYDALTDRDRDTADEWLRAHGE